MILLLAACLDYGVQVEPPPPVPALVADPVSIALEGACGGEAMTVRLTNPGTGPTTVTSLTVDGMGWTLETTPALPLTLSTLTADPDAFVDVSLIVGAGTATLTAASNAPLLDVPLRASDNQHPSVFILSPYEEQVVGADETLVLTALVSDADDAAVDLTLTWSSSATGFVATGIADADGRVEYDWPAADRAAGPQTISLIAEDLCADEGEATLFYCQDGPFLVDVLGEEAWRFDGGAAWDGSELTLVAGSEATAAGFDLFSLFDGDVLDVSFEFYVEGAEGFSFTLLDPARVTTYVGGAGCGLGYGVGDCNAGPGLPGWSVEFDTTEGGDDCAVGDHVAVVIDGEIQTPAACVATPLAGVWHTASLHVYAGGVAVNLDGVDVLDAPLTSGQDFEGFAGFTAASGALPADVRVRNVTVTDTTCVR